MDGKGLDVMGYEMDRFGRMNIKALFGLGWN
jgi:hypothetical protein